MAANEYTSFCRDVLDAIETDPELNNKYRRILQDYYFRPDEDIRRLPNDDPVVLEYLDQIRRCHSIVLSGYHRAQSLDIRDAEHPTLNIKLKNVPKPTRYDKEGSECKKYVQAHRVCGEEEPKIVQFLLNHITFISFEKFIDDFYGLIDKFNKKYSGSNEKFYIKYTPNKSSGWILDIFKDEIQVKYTPIREGVTPAELDAVIIFLDDGSYSGKQITTYVTESIKNPENFKTVTIIPYMTNRALNRLTKGIEKARKGDTTKDEIMCVEVIQTVAEIVDEYGHEIDVENLKDKIEIMRNDKSLSPINDVTLTYLEHKTPDIVSAIHQIFRTGLGFHCLDPNNKAGQQLRNYTWNCVEPVVPPYKPKSKPGVEYDEIEEFEIKNRANSLEYRQERDRLYL